MNEPIVPATDIYFELDDIRSEGIFTSDGEPVINLFTMRNGCEKDSMSYSLYLTATELERLRKEVY